MTILRVRFLTTTMSLLFFLFFVASFLFEKRSKPTYLSTWRTDTN